jgi:hypothetical protein
VCETISHLTGMRNAVSVNKPSTADEDLGSVPALHHLQGSLSPLSIPGTPTSQSDRPSLVESHPPAPITINLPRQEVQGVVGGSPLLAKPTSLRGPLVVPSRSYSSSFSSRSGNYDQLPTVVTNPDISYGVPRVTDGVTTVQPSRGRHSSRDPQDHLMMLRRKRSYSPSYKKIPSHDRPPMILSNDYPGSYGASRPQAPIAINIQPQGVQAAGQLYPVQQSGPIQVPIRPRQRERSWSRSPPIIYDYPSSYGASHPPAPIATSIPPPGVQAVGQPYPVQPPGPIQVPIVHVERSRSRSYSPSYRTRSSYDISPAVIELVPSGHSLYRSDQSPPSQGYRSQGYRSKGDTQRQVVIVPSHSPYRSDLSLNYDQPQILMAPSRNDEDNLGRLRKVWHALTK